MEAWKKQWPAWLRKNYPTDEAKKFLSKITPSTWEKLGIAPK